MKPNHPPVIETTRSRSGWFFVVAAIAVLFALYASRQAADEADERELAEQVENFEQGRAIGRAEALATVRSAWQAGLDEGQTRCAMAQQQGQQR